MKTLLLVDASSYLYRAFHALPDLRNKGGEPTAAIYGVLNMLRRLHKDTHADYSACVFDAKGKTFRDDLYPDYKATRAPMPDDLGVQIEPLHQAIVAMGWPLLMIDGVEADDVIATLACAAERQGMEVVISTGDKDLTQLVCRGIRIENANPRTGELEILDEAGVEKKFGVKPERITDYLALVGDSVDNIPGVDKVGPKTAAKWLTQYGSLDNVSAQADEIGGVVGDNLRRVRDWLPRARELLTVKSDVPLPVEVTDLTLKPKDKAKLAELFDRYEFRAWRRELDQQGGGTALQSRTEPGNEQMPVPHRLEPHAGAPRRGIVFGGARRGGLRSGGSPLRRCARPVTPCAGAGEIKAVARERRASQTRAVHQVRHACARQSWPLSSGRGS
ncbi:MAG: polymerase [Burkholderiales bacterium]|nr:polymerase [Burkholderiales bacterium]